MTDAQIKCLNDIYCNTIDIKQAIVILFALLVMILVISIINLFTKK